VQKVIAKVDGVDVLGRVEAGVQRYLGIPYAEAQRWAAPTPVKLKETFDAKAYGTVCPQNNDQVSPFQAAYNTFLGSDVGEKCLNLNVICPEAAKADSQLPVMVYLHAGGFYSGGNAEVANNPSNWVAEAKDLIVVTPNYRLGPFGWSYNQAFRGEVKGNFGLLDAIEALKWVKRNIAAFGGDPDAITVVGHSAGGVMAAYLLGILAREEYRPFGQLVHRMVISSGNHLMLPLKSPEEATEAFDIMAADMKKSATAGYQGPDKSLMAKLRACPAAKFFPVALRPKYKRTFGPVLDGLVIQEDLAESLADDRIPMLKIPVFLTTICDDGTIMVPQAVSQLSALPVEAQLRQFLAMFMPTHPHPAAVLRVYGQKVVERGIRAAVGELLTDALFYMPMQKLQSALIARGCPTIHLVTEPEASAATYFGESPGGVRHGEQLPGTEGLGAFHYTDHLLLFNAPVPHERSNDGQFGAIPQQNSKFLRELYGGFIKHGLDDPLVAERGVREPIFEEDYVEVWVESLDKHQGLPIDWAAAGVTLLPTPKKNK
jgi:carboxylesterase type B